MPVATIYKMAQLRPDKTAIIHCGVHVSYRQLASAIEALRVYFQSLKIGEGHLCAICVYSQLDSWAILLALRSLGAHTMCIQTPKHAVRAEVEGITHLVTSAADPYGSATEAAVENGWRQIIVSPDIFASAPAPDFAAARDFAEAGTHLLLTSGTTGEYKAVRINQQSLDERMKETLRLFAPDFVEDPDNTRMGYLGAVGLWSLGGFVMPMLAFKCMATVALEQRPGHEADVLSLPVVSIILTPMELVDLLKALPADAPRRDDLRILVAGGALPWAVAEQLIARVTRNVINTLGSTEIGAIGFSFLQKPGDQFLYMISPDFTVEIVDEHDAPVAQGDIGIMRIKLAEHRAEYIRRSGQMSNAIRNGYFYPGDLAQFMPDGRVCLHGRCDDVISLRGGDKAPTAPFENALQTTLGLTGACVLTVVNTERGIEETHIVLETSQPPNETLLRDVLNTFPFKAARTTTIAQLPRNRAGKIDRIALRADVLTERAA